MKRIIALFIALLLTSYAFAGGPSPLKAEQTLIVYTGDLINLKLEFWLQTDFLYVERIAETSNGNLELTLYDGKHCNCRYNLTFNSTDYKAPLIVVSKGFGVFNGCYRIKSWRNNMLSLVVDKDFQFPEDFFRTTSRYEELDEY